MLAWTASDRVIGLALPAWVRGSVRSDSLQRPIGARTQSSKLLLVLVSARAIALSCVHFTLALS